MTRQTWAISTAVPTTTTSTLTASQDAWTFLVEYEDGAFVVSEPMSNSFGSGATLLEAMVDLWSALRSTAAVLEDKKLAPRLHRELAVIKRLLRVPEGRAS